MDVSKDPRDSDRGRSGSFGVIRGDRDLYENAGVDWPLGLGLFIFDVEGPVFLSFYRICYNIASELCFGFLASRHVGP